MLPNSEASQLSRVSPRMPEKRVGKVRTFQESCLVVSRTNPVSVLNQRSTQRWYPEARFDSR